MMKTAVVWMGLSMLLSYSVTAADSFPKPEQIADTEKMYKIEGLHVASDLGLCDKNGKLNLCAECTDGAVAFSNETCSAAPSSVSEAVGLCLREPRCEAVTVDQWERAFFVTEHLLDDETMESLTLSTGNIQWPAEGYVTFMKHWKLHKAKFEREVDWAAAECKMYLVAGYQINDDVAHCDHNGFLNLCSNCTDGFDASFADTCQPSPTPNIAIKKCLRDPVCKAVTIDEWQRVLFVGKHTVLATFQEEGKLVESGVTIDWPASGYETIVKACPEEEPEEDEDTFDEEEL